MSLLYVTSLCARNTNQVQINFRHIFLSLFALFINFFRTAQEIRRKIKNVHFWERQKPSESVGNDKRERWVCKAGFGERKSFRSESIASIISDVCDLGHGTWPWSFYCNFDFWLWDYNQITNKHRTVLLNFMFPSSCGGGGGWNVCAILCHKRPPCMNCLRGLQQ